MAVPRRRSSRRSEVARPRFLRVRRISHARTSRARLLGRLSADRLKADVIAAYGGTCGECGESRPECLQIDHIDNDGRHQVRRGLPRAGPRLYRKLRREGWPRDKVQLLCANCNLVKALRFRRDHVKDADEVPDYPGPERGDDPDAPPPRPGS
ncbi:MAG TPA: hypothetical protein VM222_02105 [Planctomycetota bacterium]|nr:hypothetical protein [Planctomycetota bacterium]